MDAPQPVPAPRFRVVRFRDAYDIDEVDAFVDRCTIALDRGDTTDLTAAAIRDVRFTPKRFRPGYDMTDVDRYLDEVATELQRRGPQTS